MNEIEHEGKTYILKSTVETIIKERVSKVAARASEAEAKAGELESQLKTFEKQQTNYDVLASQVSTLKGELEQERTRFNRYQSISKLGITDNDLIDVVEWSYDRATKTMSAKEKPSLGDWLNEQMTNPEEAPASIRPHLKALQSAEAPAATNEISDHAEDHFEAPEHASDHAQLYALNEHQQRQAPNVNKGAVKAPEAKDILQRAGKGNQDFYNQNVDAIKKAWFAKHGR